MAVSLRARLESKIQKKPLLGHCFYQRWQQGKLSKEELQGYAKEYYAFEKEFPRFLSSIHASCTDADARRGILENLNHEEGGPENHPELWLRFAEGLGVDREDVKSHFHSDETEHLLRVFRKHSTSGNPVTGLAALYAYERQQPDVARTKIEGLQEFYGIGDDRTLQFFRTHQETDVYHADTEIELLTRLAADETSQDEVVKAAEETLDALYDFLDGVERRYGKQAA